MKEFNAIAIGCVAIFAGFCASFFFIGSEEGLSRIIKEYYIYFPLRFIAFTLFGMLWFTPLVVLNLTINKIFKLKISIIGLIKLGVIIIAIGSLVGTSAFYLDCFGR
ncbi:hypothetical protein [Pedobacter chitinilyticus]|uniref:Uncharacterized protein n=1 Tax=Pedobacter chitinilyticus TaxID=2233776 RepID=A0A443YML1_9SPHI|nr:hypothetical protein [Pedobacter chitinilyticus]RWU05015.1 hypothetical protein DPV69_17790 [Pedobacter chitinilyticus]